MFTVGQGFLFCILLASRCLELKFQTAQSFLCQTHIDRQGLVTTKVTAQVFETGCIIGFKELQAVQFLPQAPTTAFELFVRNAYGDGEVRPYISHKYLSHIHSSHTFCPRGREIHTVQKYESFSLVILQSFSRSESAWFDERVSCLHVLSTELYTRRGMVGGIFQIPELNI